MTDEQIESMSLESFATFVLETQAQHRGCRPCSECCAKLIREELVGRSVYSIYRHAFTVKLTALQRVLPAF
jgi:hypothetical protein